MRLLPHLTPPLLLLLLLLILLHASPTLSIRGPPEEEQEQQPRPLPQDDPPVTEDPSPPNTNGVYAPRVVATTLLGFLASTLVIAGLSLSRDNKQPRKPILHILIHSTRSSCLPQHSLPVFENPTFPPATLMPPHGSTVDTPMGDAHLLECQQCHHG
eukprot:GFKZ01000632.1.p2 GENE.GFKZ01000632.1~~GFKZ01000632.1.p2  ORF type:complete len:157 (-),score=13.23 GFKZ01000632.1:3582-4052(-)